MLELPESQSSETKSRFNSDFSLNDKEQIMTGQINTKKTTLLNYYKVHFADPGTLLEINVILLEHLELQRHC